MTDVFVPDDLHHLFTYHAPQEGQVLLYERAMEGGEGA